MHALIHELIINKRHAMLQEMTELTCLQVVQTELCHLVASQVLSR